MNTDALQLQKRLKKSKLAQGISIISTGTKYKEETFWNKLLSCLKGSHKYRNSMRRRARKAGHLANSVSKLDSISRVVFPSTFLIINIIYWSVYYLNGRR
ncbi:hypothetical protein EB796_019066 [Bugula neritina]|uniref:Uncharacterized protein n=1 Tax=Bugula neritina TaxID=10212 RepID=A0A7J7JB76_BUGNE|nr:hypothetical protein EB796_019066 [Bugula neritina]